MGKSRLAEALAERIAAEPHIRCAISARRTIRTVDLFTSGFIVRWEQEAGFAHGDTVRFPPVQVIRRPELSRSFVIAGERPLSGYRRPALNVFRGRIAV